MMGGWRNGGRSPSREEIPDLPQRAANRFPRQGPDQESAQGSRGGPPTAISLLIPSLVAAVECSARAGRQKTYRSHVRRSGHFYCWPAPRSTTLCGLCITSMADGAAWEPGGSKQGRAVDILHRRARSAISCEHPRSEE